MKLKRLAAFALAGTMVFGMTACGESEEKNVSVDTVVEAFDAFTKEQDKNYSLDTSFVMKMMADDHEVYMEMNGTSSSYDGVTYQKSTSKNNMFGPDMEVSEESYTITKDDSVVIATKTSEDEEWDVYTEDDEDVEEETKKALDVAELKKSAKMETEGDNCYVTMEVDAADMDIDAGELMGDEMPDMKVQVKVTYNKKESAIKSVEIGFDLEAMNKNFEELGEVELKEFSMKIDNIKKNTKAIEIPSEIELD